MQKQFQLIFLGLQSAGAAFILSGALASMLRYAFTRPVHPSPEVLLGAVLWFVMGLFCLAPVLLALVQRLKSAGAYSDDQAWKWRQAAVISLTSTSVWWLAPALLF
jgi:hypothetical protein